MSDNSPNVKPYNNKQQLLFPPAIQDYLQESHLAHVVDEAVDTISIQPFMIKIPNVGNPSYHPAMMIKIWFYGYATKTYSSRKIEEKLHTDVGFIFLAGMQKPDFKTISEFRRKNIEELRNSFVEILKICHGLGMTELGNISIDSKVMKANASAKRSYSEEELIEEQKELEKGIQEYLEKANQIDEEEDKRYGPDKCGNELPEDIRDKGQRIKKMKQIVEQLKQAKEKISKTEEEKINLTDNDAKFQRDKWRRIPGYRAHIAVDSKEQVIVANDVSNQQNDSNQLLPMIDKVIENVDKVAHNKFLRCTNEKEKINIPADSGYCSGKNLSELEKGKYKDKVEPFIPDTAIEQIKKGKGSSHKEDPRFDKSKFIYNPDDDTLSCPAGKKLHHIAKENKRGVMYDVYGNTTECKKCGWYGKCTNSKQGRRISILEYQPFIDKMREKLSTEQGKKIYLTRQITAEPVFGNLSHNLGYRGFLLRGVKKVKGEFSIMCIAHNLLKIAKFLRGLGLTLKERVNLQNFTPIFNTS